jgi:uncharacterized membrane protein
MGGPVQPLSLGVSADGSVIVGVVFDRSPNFQHAFRWTQSAGAQNLGAPVGMTSVRGVSADGSVIVGNFLGPIGHAPPPCAAEAVAGDAAPIDPAAPLTAHDLCMAAAGSRTVANVYRWTASGGAQNLGTLGMSGQEAKVSGVSADGSVIAGYFWDTEGRGQTQVYRWTASGGVENLGSVGLARPWGPVLPLGISADGSVILESVHVAQNITHVFRWTQSGTVQDLGTVGGFLAGATSVSADGAVIAGNFMAVDNGQMRVGHAFRWTQSGGMQDLSSIVQDAAVNVVAHVAR